MLGMSDDLPALLVLGPRGHGVVEYALDVASAVCDARPDAATVRAEGLPEALDVAERASSVHLHVTDRLLGASPEAAAGAVELVAERTRLSLTLHDVPQRSDGAMLHRRVAAYRRFVDAASGGVAVSSVHEQTLLADSVGRGRVLVVPLGVRRARAPAPLRRLPPAPARDLVVLIAGFVYPGKGHAVAIAAAASAAAAIRAGGEEVGAVVVRAIGRASSGHERDVDALTAEAAGRGVTFEVTGFLADDDFAHRMADDGVPLAAHEHVSASRSMLDWIEAGRRPLVVRSPYAAETASLRPGTMALYRPADLAAELCAAWRDPARTRLDAGAPLGPTLADAAGRYLEWWAG